MADFASVSARMRDDWDRRAAEDAAGYIYTRDGAESGPDFDESGRLNYIQLLRPHLPILLDGRPAPECRIVEIGCGAGRMTQWIARDFAHVDALDVSPAMISEASRRVASLPNVTLRVSSGCDLRPLPDRSADLVFSYIVFQHIPSVDVIFNYVREAARVLKPGGGFRFQVNGDPAVRSGVADTWTGAGVSLAQLRPVLESAGFSLVAAEAPETQYFFVSAVLGPKAPRVSFVVPGLAAPVVTSGFGATGGNWIPIEADASAVLDLPEGRNRRLHVSLYIWPGERGPLDLTAGACRLRITEPGDHVLESPVPDDWPAGPRTVTVRITPPPARKPALRSLGFYSSASPRL